jgi:dynein heavy chain
MLMAAGFISYLGPFTATYRSELIHHWNNKTLEAKVPVDAEFDLTRVLSDPIQLRQWRIMGLPADDFSIQNGIVASQGQRWPLMIDPQQQANRWIRNLYKKSNLQIFKLNDANYLRSLDNSIRFGQPALLEDVGEQLDADIEPVLLKQTFKKGGQLLIRLNDTDVPYQQDFKFFITTKLANPHYLPEIFVKVTIINFTVTEKGLTDQLLVLVCSMERPELEEKNDRLTVQIAADQGELDAIESRILKMLAEATGFILDDEELIQTLADSRTTSDQVAARVEEAKGIIRDLRDTRDEYRTVARRGSILYFVISDMSRVDPMYQYSLQYFSNLIRSRIEDTRDGSNSTAAEDGEEEEDEEVKAAVFDSDSLEARLNLLTEDFTMSVYNKICAGLFEKDKLLFSFLIAANISRDNGNITEEEWGFFLRGPDAASRAQVSSPNPAAAWLDAEIWVDLNASIDVLKQLVPVLEDPATQNVWKMYYESFSSVDHPLGFEMPEPCKSLFTPFQKLLLIKLFHPDKLEFACRDFIQEALADDEFIKSPPFDLDAVYQASDNKTPIIFVLSSGADPIPYLTKLAKQKGREDQLRLISLGQDQGPLAKDLMDIGRKEGAWVCLQNCHLSVSWLPELERILDAYEQNQEECHEEYRLFLTSMPTGKFPVSILQRSMKITNEPPKGLSNNLMRTFLDITEEEYEYCGASESELVQNKARSYKKLLFGLAFFHAVIQERRKFGAVGWNIPYEWMASDLEVSKKQLKLFVCDSTSEEIPYETLQELVGIINYSGRVTDDKDGKLVRSLLSKFFSPQILSDEYKFVANDDVYHAPVEGTLSEVMEYISNLPNIESPEVFGLHANADINYNLKESHAFMKGLIDIQPKGGNSTGGNSSDDVVDATCERILSLLPENLDRKTAHESTFAGMDEGQNTLGVFLRQEADRFNNLLGEIRVSLVDVRKAMKGLVVMSSALEELYSAILFNRVPEAWTSYPSLKSLANWFDDLLLRMTTLDKWFKEGPPKAFWISGFFFPQGFLTAVLQRYARATSLPIDTLRYRTHVTEYASLEDVPAEAESGAYMYGHYLQGAQWDKETKTLAESAPGVLFSKMPVIWLEPETVENEVPDSLYQCPVYTTSKRAGALSTTGHSTNFVQYCQLPSSVQSDHWVRRGAALLLQLDP